MALTAWHYKITNTNIAIEKYINFSLFIPHQIYSKRHRQRYNHETQGAGLPLGFYTLRKSK